MAHPARNAPAASILNPSRTFFVTTKAAMGKRLLQSERNAELLIDVLRSLVAEGRFELHDFVIMPDHLHLLLTVRDGMSIEKAMQLVKGRFSHRLSKELGYPGEVWQRGFTEEQMMNRESFNAHGRYIAENPVKSGLSAGVDEYPFRFGYLARKKTNAKQGLKP
jgi:putative transposase